MAKLTKRELEALLHREWMRGYACCLATLIRMEGCHCANSDELLSLVGSRKLRAAKVEEYDARVIFDKNWTFRKDGK